VVREASDRSEVLGLFSRETFDLVLLDLETAPADGIELTCALCDFEADGLNTPVYALVSPASAADRDAYRKAGIHGFLNKPVEIDAILNIIAAIALRPVQSRVAPQHARRAAEPRREEVSLSLRAV
jgi:DNA-binding response OmpR family regulator